MQGSTKMRARKYASTRADTSFRHKSAKTSVAMVPQTQSMPACAVAALVSHGINSECPSFPASKPSPRNDKRMLWRRTQRKSRSADASDCWRDETCFRTTKPQRPRGLTGGISTVRKAAIPPWQQSADVNLVADVRARQPRTPAIAAADSATPHHTGDHR